jgi:two-component system invasion response regulator UvrY
MCRLIQLIPNLVGKMIRVLIVDDFADVRAALKRIIEKTTDIEVAGEAADGREALQSVERINCDVVLLDISLPGISGLEVLAQIKNGWPNLPVLMVSVHTAELYGTPALRAGASGYLTKDKVVEQLALAIRTVSQGCVYLSSEVLTKV